MGKFKSEFLDFKGIIDFFPRKISKKDMSFWNKTRRGFKKLSYSKRFVSRSQFFFTLYSIDDSTVIKREICHSCMCNHFQFYFMVL